MPCLIDNFILKIYMVFNFRLVSDEVEHFKREIKIDGHATFLDLRNAICDAVGFRKDELSSFFLCEKGWEKDKEITLIDMGDDMSEDAYIMEECVLSDYIEDEGQRLIYTFDFMNDRSFFLELKEIIMGSSLQEPLCTLSLGQAPAQFVEPEPLFKESAKTNAAKPTTLDDFDDTLFEEEGFNPEELDDDGFSEMTFDE